MSKAIHRATVRPIAVDALQVELTLLDTHSLEESAAAFVISPQRAWDLANALFTQSASHSAQHPKEPSRVNPKAMTLKQWQERYGHNHCVPRGDCVGILDPPTEGSPALFHLSDFIVTSRCGNAFMLKPAPVAEMPDPRYTCDREYVGFSRPQYVVRFCGDRIAAAPTHHAAERYAREDWERRLYNQALSNRAKP